MLVLVLKILLKVLIISAAFIASYLLIVILLSHIPVNKDAEQPHSGNVVYLTSDGIHIDVHLPVHSNHYDWSGFLPTYTFKAGKQVYEYITFGWGDWGFYLDTPTWAELKPKTLLKAAFLKTPTVMHVSYLTAPPVETKKKIKKIILSDDQMDVLKEHIQGSFKLDENGNPIMIPDRGYEENDNFYLAEGSYHLFRTCNSWVNEAMKKMGVRTAVWSPASLGVFRHLD